MRTQQCRLFVQDMTFHLLFCFVCYRYRAKKGAIAWQNKRCIYENGVPSALEHVKPQENGFVFHRGKQYHHFTGGDKPWLPWCVKENGGCDRNADQSFKTAVGPFEHPRAKSGPFKQWVDLFREAKKANEPCFQMSLGSGLQSPTAGFHRL